MTYTPVTFERFGGWNLRDDPEEIGAEGAIDLANVVFDDRGRVKTRPGYTAGATGISGAVGTIFARDGSTALVLSVDAGATTTFLDEISGGSTTTTNVGSWTPAMLFSSAVNIGTPTATYTFIATTDPVLPLGGTGRTVRRYGGPVTTSVGKCSQLGVTPWDNRLVQGGFIAAADSPTGANGSRHTVFFSDAGAPETFSANNYIHLDPGDGERITNVASYKDVLVVFKETRAFVFYGTSTDPTGNPIFNYRTLTLPDNLVPYSAASGQDGIYFVGQRGAYRTDGYTITTISDAIRPYFTTTTWMPAQSQRFRVYFAAERLFISASVNFGLDQQTLVYDPQTGEWTAWGFAAGAPRGFVDLQPFYGATPRTYFLAGTTPWRLDPDLTTDTGSAIRSFWQSGFYDLGAPERKVIRETALWGSGTPTLAVYTDHGASDALAAAVTLGAAPAVAEGVQRVARRGVFFAHRISATSGAWSVNRVVHRVRDQRVPGTKPT